MIIFYAFLIALLLWASWATLNIAYNRRKRLVYALFLAVFAIPGVLLDVLFQVTVATVLFLELPKETTLSMRLTRYISGRTPDKKGTANYGYRVKLAVWIATYLVEPWQPGHIGLEKYGYPAARDAIKTIMKRIP
jgi:hypothetical protein